MQNFDSGDSIERQEIRLAAIEDMVSRAEDVFESYLLKNHELPDEATDLFEDLNTKAALVLNKAKTDFNALITQQEVDSIQEIQKNLYKILGHERPPVS